MFKTWNERIDLRVSIMGSDPNGLQEECESFVNNLDFDALAERIIDKDALQQFANSEFDGDIDLCMSQVIADEALRDYLETIDNATTGSSALAVGAVFRK